jgi:hypothetical protein
MRRAAAPPGSPAELLPLHLIARPYDRLMPEESAPHPRWRRVLAGVAGGAAVAAAVAAVVAPVIMWAIRSPVDVTAMHATEVGVAAMIAGAIVIVVLALPRLTGRSQNWPLPLTLAGLICAWGLWRAVDTYRGRDAWPFVDSTGASIVAVVAGLCAMSAVLLAFAATVISRPSSRSAALCAFLVAAVAIPAVTYQIMHQHRSEVWRPDLTAASATPAAVPDVVGPVRYNVRLGDERERSPDIYTAGNGFVVDTSREITAYDGPTGEKRWHATGYGTSGQFLVVRRDRDDTAGIVVIFLFHGIVALDGSTGEVLWRRQYSSGGKVTAATGSIDALGMAVFTADAVESGSNSRTRFYSLDPATGRERWNKPIECSNPTLSPGTPSQFSFACGKASLINARTGEFVEVPGKQAPTAGTDLYVSSSTRWDDQGLATEETIVIDPEGRVVDEIHNAEPISYEHNGFFLLDGGEALLMRDSRAHRSTPLPLTDIASAHRGWPPSAWLNDRILIAADGRSSPLYLIDPARPTEKPAMTPPPCPRESSLRDLYATAGAVLAECGRTEIVALAP